MAKEVPRRKTYPGEKPAVPIKRHVACTPGTTQFPDVHVYPDGHVLPQAPQLAADVVGSMQALEQEICGGVQDVAVGSPKSERSAEEAVLSRAVACPCHFCGEVVVDRW